MQYMLLVYDDERFLAEKSESELQKLMQQYVSYSKELAAAGVLRAGSELAPVRTATTVRVRNGKALTTDGPFAETKEQLGGYYLIDVPNLDEAIRWAAKVPSAAHGSIEVRPQTGNQALLRV
jgi:hypothetical protein